MMKPRSPNLANILDTCLTRMEAGSSIDEIVDEYVSASPEKADELRNILQIAAAAQPGKENLRVPAAAQRASRTQFLAQAQKLQQQPGAAGFRFWLRFLRLFQQNLGSITFAAATIVLLTFALGSLNALPGDGLYPVKLAAEQAGIDLASSGSAREEQVSIYDSRRAEEVANMIRMKRSGAVSFGGYLKSAKDKSWQVTGINLQLPQELEKQAQMLSGAYVEIQGRLGNLGTVQVESLKPRLEALTGTIASIEPDRWKVDSHVVVINTDTRINGNPQVGDQVLVQAAHLADSLQVLAISVNVTAAKDTATASPTASPQVSLTATATVYFSATPEPTGTAIPTINAKPIATQVPENQDNPQPQSTHEPESEPHDSSHSGSSNSND